MVKTRKEFLTKFMELAHIDTIERADEIAQVIIALIKDEIGEDLSHRIAETVPPDLAKGWESISLEITKKEFSGSVTPEEHAQIRDIHRKDFSAKVTHEEHQRVKKILKRDFG